ncbi:hypothetical protein ERJ75_001299400 [Trypanosoma vivax]|nr:hypothetical protein ERJ75_001299300 [Trypanosoma vivax]KAH8608519.1 hypothetical protein ERJ75_001299400 [Trypanosoma vivax]
MEHSGPYGLGAGGGPTGHQNTNLKKAHGRSERCKREWGRGAGQCTGHRVTVDSGACQRGTWSTQDHMVWERVGANRPPEHQPEEGARPEREVQREWGRGAGQCTGHRVTVDSGACQRGTWSTQDHMVWERVGGQQATRTPT